MEFFTGLLILVFVINIVTVFIPDSGYKNKISSLIDLTRQIKTELSRIREQMIRDQISANRDRQFFVEEITKLYDRMEEKKEQNL